MSERADLPDASEAAVDAIAEFLWRRESSEYDYSRDDPTWNELADAILVIVVEQGWTPPDTEATQ